MARPILANNLHTVSQCRDIFRVGPNPAYIPLYQDHVCNSITLGPDPTYTPPYLNHVCNIVYFRKLLLTCINLYLIVLNKFRSFEML